MAPRLPFGAPCFSAALALTVAASACGGKTGDCGEPIYDETSDEAWRSMIDQESRVMRLDEKAPRLIEPSEGQTYRAGDPPPTLKWTSPLHAAIPGDSAGGALAKAARSAAPQRSTAPWDRIAELFVGVAWAHGPVVNGDIYDLKITVPGRKCPIEILTAKKTEFAISAETWRAIAATNGQPLAIEITGAYMRDNHVKEGPYRSAQPRTFKVVP